ncbi:MAG: hypothetical protein ABIF10_07715 [Candidatus Woesearchaeota archaeon]
MQKNLGALQRLEAAVVTYLAEHESRKHMYSEYPKIDIDGTFALWDRYLAFLDTHKSEEENARNAWEEKYNQPSQPIVYFYGDLISQMDHQFNPFWKGLKKTLAEHFDWGYRTKSAISDILWTDFKDADLSRFFFHDINHLHADLLGQFLSVSEPMFLFNVDRMANHRDEVKDFLEKFNDDPEFFFAHMAEPYKMLHFIAASEQGKASINEPFSPSRLAWQTAYTLQNRYCEARCHLSKKASPAGINEIIVDAEDFTAKGNSGVVFFNVYNLAKNSYKKFIDNPNKSMKIYIQIYEAPHDTYVVTVGDSGSPIDLNVMKDKTRRKILKDGVDGVAWLSEAVRNKFLGWQSSDFKVADLSVGDLSELAFMARMSGSDNNDTFSSGMGLFGINYLLSQSAGRILYGEDFTTGGPVFTCVLPKEFPTNPIEKKVFGLYSWLNERTLYAHNHFKPSPLHA